ncbi:LOW QUALITY PROTEIN: mRNA-capping enzyme [Macrobrachium rosenbergii]|uniref:LOW QUALITY PROTEIN: mRNA-capping enzyme n=1 Tax=Macrobrachium rosenbergii TaxID=79674 RepID=UPI0034D652C4
MRNKMPERWEIYKSMGRQIPGTRFICFKVPLRVGIVQNAVSKGAEWFCPRTLMDHCHSLGLIVDLTNTDRYYNSSDFTSQGIKHIKIPTAGKVIPSPRVSKQFFNTVHTFLEENKENVDYHCTHGLNRTGYLVCRYMIEHLGVPPDQAISDFNSARGHNQEREEYLTHLRQLKWQQEPAVSSDSENEEEATEVKTPTDNQRRGKRNFDAIRSQPKGSKGGLYRPGALPKGPAILDSNAKVWDDRKGACPKSGFKGVYNSGALATKMTMMNLGPLDQQESGHVPPTQNAEPGRMVEAAEPHKKATNRGHQQSQGKVKTSPFGGQRYYDSHYQGRAVPQYDFNFYQQQGSGLGPYKNSPRWSRNVRWEGNSTQGRPRQYQGPRQYATPPKEKLDFSSTPKAHGSRRNPFSPATPATYRRRSNPFSPGTSNNIFSPEASKTFSPKTRSYRRN